MAEKIPGLSDQDIDFIKEEANTIRYGTITLVFQDGILIQVDKSEKIRMEKTNR